MLWVGSGRNGKGVLVNLILKLLGDYASPGQSELLLDNGRVRNSASHSADILMLRGLRSLWFNEVPETAKWDSSRLKTFSGGDVQVDIDIFVEANQSLPVLPEASIGEIEEAIGKNCAELINDGDTLQLGIGAIPDAVCHQLKHKRNLGIHSEMLGDGVVELYEAGAIDNSLKGIDKGKFVFNFVMGSKRLYDFCDKNEACLLKVVDYVNDPSVIAKNPSVVSINGGLAVDFYGQISFTLDFACQLLLRSS